MSTKLELTAKKNGVEVPISEISLKTFKNLREHSIETFKSLQHPEPKPEPPKLRHGDYGMGNDGFIHLAGTTYWLGIVGSSFPTTRPDRDFAPNVSGNLAKDLERNKVDLEDCSKHSSKFNGSIKFSIKPFKETKEKLLFWFETECGYFDLNEATEIHQKLGQMLATARRQKK